MFSKVEKIAIPKGIEVTILKSRLRVSGLRAESFIDVDPLFHINLEGSEALSLSFKPELLSDRIGQKRKSRHYMPLFTTLKKNVEQTLFGISIGFTKQLDLVGVGYKADLLESSVLTLKLGYSHEVVIKIPQGIEAFCPKETLIVLKSHSKELLGSFVSKVQKFKTPDAYKNKGLLIRDQIIQKKKFKKK